METVPARAGGARAGGAHPEARPDISAALEFFGAGKPCRRQADAETPERRVAAQLASEAQEVALRRRSGSGM